MNDGKAAPMIWGEEFTARPIIIAPLHTGVISKIYSEAVMMIALTSYLHSRGNKLTSRSGFTVLNNNVGKLKGR